MVERGGGFLGWGVVGMKILYGVGVRGEGVVFEFFSMIKFCSWSCQLIGITMVHTTRAIFGTIMLNICEVPAHIVNIR